MSFTPNQLGAIEHRGNTLVIAAAGAGKTGTLVEKCKRLLLRGEPRVSIRSILVVTFTEAAAAEVRERIRAELNRQLAAAPENDWIQEQLAHLDSAAICTLHSFCFDLIRQHLLELDLDPGVSILEPAEARLLFLNTLDLFLTEHLAGMHANSGALKELIRSQFGGWDRPLRDFVQQLHEFTQTRPDPEGWFAREAKRLSCANSSEWHRWHDEGVKAWCEWWMPHLAALPAENSNAHECLRILRDACAANNWNVAPQILARDEVECWPKKKKTAHRAGFDKIFEEAAFLASLTPEEGARHPLDQDWDWMRGPLLLLLDFAHQFTRRFSEEKSSRGVADFHDLEQLALRVLIDPATGEPTAAARDWQKRFDAVFVDEYQDINAAQDLILSAVSRPEPGNRFLVGDVKQSIYRFRQADPSIFQRYLAQPASAWAEFPLTENFRSHETILRFINPIFGWLMRPEFGGVVCDERAQLRFGAPEERGAMAHAAKGPARVEMHLFIERKTSEAPEEEIDNTEAEARAIATRLLELKQRGTTIYDQKAGCERPVEWRDMVVLLRAAKHRVEYFARAFAEAGVPLQARRDAFFSTQEVLDLYNVLTILDNPIQDIPLAGVLHSPIAGLTANDLAAVRAEIPDGSLWRALHRFLERKTESSTRRKIERFCTLYNAWRNPRDCYSLHQRLERILSDTGYGDWLLTQPRGRERYANVQQLLRIARRFDESRGESLYLFVRHLEELQDAVGDIEPAASGVEDAVRLMTVHQSKGLEFPVAVVAELGKRLNLSAQRQPLLIDEQYGLCSLIQPPEAETRYPSLTLWLARRKERLETTGEEMRILYVALTRAQNFLFLFGSARENGLSRWSEFAEANISSQQMLRLGSWLDWIAASTAREFGNWWEQEELARDGVRFHATAERVLLTKAEGVPPAKLSADELRALRGKLRFDYPFSNATAHTAKTTVTRLRKAEHDEEAAHFPTGGGGVERGLATHTLLEHLDLAGPFDQSALRRRAAELTASGFLDPNDVESIDFAGIEAFWNSGTGRALCSRRDFVYREFPFTARITAAEIGRAGLEKVMIPEGEFVVVQGIADLILLDEKELWVIDFKTDAIAARALTAAAERYRSQVALYALALESICGRSTTRRGIYFLTLREMVWL